MSSGPTPRAAAVIVAGGSGERLGHPGGKQLIDLAGRPMVAWAVLAFDRAPSVELIVVACPVAERERFIADALEPLGATTPIVVVASGTSRQESVGSALAALPSCVELVAVHDGARPLVTPELVEAALQALDADPRLDGVVVGHPSVDTVKIVEGETVASTPDRSTLWTVQTPQVFRIGALKAARLEAEDAGFVGTDDASLVERSGGLLRVLPGPRDNIKVTVPSDLIAAQALLEAREGAS